MDEKICTGCDRSLPLSAFHRKGEGTQSRCKDCRRASVNEPRTYDPDSSHSFFRDLTLAALRERPDARERLDRHMQETRDVKGTSGGGTAGLIPPGYLADQWVAPAASPRPLADAAQKFPMPEYGDDFVVPVMSTS